MNNAPTWSTSPYILGAPAIQSGGPDFDPNSLGASVPAVLKPTLASQPAQQSGGAPGNWGLGSGNGVGLGSDAQALSRAWV
jgi:hypothetical protein